MNLRATIGGFARRTVSGRKGLRRDLISGLVLGVESIPDALASGVLAGVNPLNGLYAVMLATPIGAIFAGSVFLSVQTTSAMSLVVAGVGGVSGAGDMRSLFTLSLLTGIIMLLAGVFKLGRLMRFVSNSVMVGFMNGVALLIILGQLGSFTGYSSTYSNKVARLVDLLFHLTRIDLATIVVGFVAIILIIVLERTKLKALGMVVALIIASILPPLFGWTSVERVSDIATITSGLPKLSLPDFSAIPDLIVPAVSLAVIGLIQGAGVSQTYANPDGRFPDISRDFVGQGAANIAVSFFRGMPVGGSISATSLVVASGARTRFANIFAGILMVIITLLFAGAVGRLAMPALAALLIVIGFRTLKPAAVRSVWGTGTIQKTMMAITFGLVLAIPLQYAVLAGVALSIVLYTFRQSNQVRLKSWRIREGQLPVEEAVPKQVEPNSVTVLTPYGSLFYAAAPVFEQQLPALIRRTRAAVVIVNLRGYTELGSTFMQVLQRYGAELKSHGSRLMLAELEPATKEQLTRAGIVDSVSRRNLFMRTERVGESLFDAQEAAHAWIDGLGSGDVQADAAKTLGDAGGGASAAEPDAAEGKT